MNPFCLSWQTHYRRPFYAQVASNEESYCPRQARIVCNSRKPHSQ